MRFSFLFCGISQIASCLAGRHSALDRPTVTMVKKGELFFTAICGPLSNISIVLGENLKNWLKTGMCMGSVKVLLLQTVGLVCFGWPLWQDWHIYVERAYLVFNLKFYTHEWWTKQNERFCIVIVFTTSSEMWKNIDTFYCGCPMLGHQNSYIVKFLDNTVEIGH